MKKNNNLYLLMLGAILLLSGCVMYPDKNVGDVALPEPLPVFGKNHIFEERQANIKISVASQGSENAITENAKRFLRGRDFITVTEFGKAYDVIINFSSSFRQIAPAPRCILLHNLGITVSSSSGVALLSPWQHKTESTTPSKNFEIAKNFLITDINNSIENWIKNSFLPQINQNVKASILRYKVRRDLIEIDPTIFETEIRTLLNNLRSVPGVISVAMVEANSKDRIASFRVCYRSDVVAGKLSEKIK